MRTAQGIRLLGYGLYGVMMAVGLFALIKPQAFRVLLLSSSIIAIACVSLIVFGVRTVAPPEKRWIRHEGWVLYAMYAVAAANLALGIFATFVAPLTVLSVAFCLAAVVWNADKFGDYDQDWPSRY